MLIKLNAKQYTRDSYIEQKKNVFYIPLQLRLYNKSHAFETYFPSSSHLVDTKLYLFVKTIIVCLFYTYENLSFIKGLHKVINIQKKKMIQFEND